MPDFAAARAITAATRKILSTTRAILALTWFCHLRMYLWSLGGAWGAPRGDPPPYTWKKLQCLKMIFRPFGEKKIKKNWIWKMTLADPPPSMEFSIIFFFFWTLPLPKNSTQKTNNLVIFRLCTHPPKTFKCPPRIYTDKTIWIYLRGCESVQSYQNIEVLISKHFLSEVKHYVYVWTQI